MISFQISFNSFITSKLENFTFGFQVFLSDPKAESQIKSQKFTIEGPPLKSLEKPFAYKKYTVRVLKFLNLENDPNFPCKDYENDGEYNQCLEEEYIRQTHELINCTPPWMTDNQDNWCKHHINTSEETREKSWSLLGKYHSNYDKDYDHSVL